MSSEDRNPHAGIEIGRLLERTRLDRGLSLWQVEEATKIRARYLLDLERENFDVLPAVYMLGSLKTYADFLGLDGEALVQELKNRQAPAQEADHTTREEAPWAEGLGGFLASLAALLGFGGRDAEAERGPTDPATGRGPRLYWGLGGILIFALLVSLVPALGENRPVVLPEVRDPALSEAPARLALSSEVENEGDKERAAEEGTRERSREEAKAPEEGDRGDGEGDETDKVDVDEGDRDAEEAGQEAGDEAMTLPEPPTASASAASASASAFASASAPSSVASSASATPAATVPPPATAAPETANPGDAPAAGNRPAPATAGVPGGPARAVAAPAARPAQRVGGDVRIVRRVVRYVR